MFFFIISWSGEAVGYSLTESKRSQNEDYDKYGTVEQ